MNEAPSRDCRDRSQEVEWLLVTNKADNGAERGLSNDVLDKDEGDDGRLVEGKTSSMKLREPTDGGVEQMEKWNRRRSGPDGGGWLAPKQSLPITLPGWTKENAPKLLTNLLNPKLRTCSKIAKGKSRKWLKLANPLPKYDPNVVWVSEAAATRTYDAGGSSRAAAGEDAGEQQDEDFETDFDQVMRGD
ncbi:hypothetical protein RJT34_19794 [Clitoria ternatea]|uniref:Uncharacterized protein n=1 Tax=Clitoria ternatea TaxID=43366 RepID=A0AAN9IRR1_CLITE